MAGGKRSGEEVAGFSTTDSDGAAGEALQQGNEGTGSRSCPLEFLELHTILPLPERREQGTRCGIERQEAKSATPLMVKTHHDLAEIFSNTQSETPLCR